LIDTGGGRTGPPYPKIGGKGLTPLLCEFLSFAIQSVRPFTAFRALYKANFSLYEVIEVLCEVPSVKQLSRPSAKL